MLSVRSTVIRQSRATATAQAVAALTPVLAEVRLRVGEQDLNAHRVGLVGPAPSLRRDRNVVYCVGDDALAFAHAYRAKK